MILDHLADFRKHLKWQLPKWQKNHKPFKQLLLTSAQTRIEDLHWKSLFLTSVKALVSLQYQASCLQILTFTNQGVVSKCFKYAAVSIEIVCHELIVMTRLAGNQVAGGTPAVTSLF